MSDTKSPSFEGVVVSIGKTGYTTEVRTPSDGGAPGHTLIADEPESVGGANRGPGPYELLLASLGACKAMTVRMYADRKGWPLEECVIALRHDRRHPDDCENCEGDEDKIGHIDVDLQFVGEELTGEQLERLAEIADRCPVHKTITGELRVNSTLVRE